MSAPIFGAWRPLERFIFRVACLFFVTMSIPLSWSYYERLFTLNWFNLNYRDITNMGRFSPSLITIPTESGRWGLASYVDWGVILLVALAGALLWSLFDKRKEYRKLYYWLRVVVRYRVAIGMIEFGFVKVFLVQMPFPPISTLNTNFGDITAQKLYWLSVGIVPTFEVFLGFVEVIAGFLLFFRKTATIGAFLTACASANIVYINHAYDGGVHVYSAYFVLLCLLLLWRDIPRIGKLLIREQDVVPASYYPAFSSLWARYLRYGVKTGFVFLFVVLLSALHWRNFHHDHYVKTPATPGLSGAEGYYQVTEFQRNGEVLPYSPFDSVRWQDAIFETHSTLTFKVNESIQISLSNGVPRIGDVLRDWELTGTAGGRHFYYYEADTVNQQLRLENKHMSATFENRGRGNRRQGKESGSQFPKSEFVLHYDRPDHSRIILDGVTEKADSIHVVLDKVERRYPLVERDGY